MENTKGILIWQSLDYSEFYLSNYNYYSYSFLDEKKILEIMLLVTQDADGDIGPSYSILRPMLNNGINTDMIIGMPFTHPIKLDTFYPYTLVEYDMLLQNNLRARLVLGKDIFLQNSDKLKNFKLGMQLHNVMLPVNKMEPYRLYILQNSVLKPTSVRTRDIIEFLINNADLVHDITAIPLDKWATPPSPVTALTGGPGAIIKLGV